MGKLLVFMAAMILVLLQLAAQLYPASPLFWVASVAPAFTVIRVSLALVLLWILLLPPKSKSLRLPIGLAAIGFTAWVIGTTYEGTIGFIDSLTLISAAVAIDLALLESKPANEPFKSAEYAAAMRDTAIDWMRVAFGWAAQLGWLLYMNVRILAESQLSTEEALTWLGTTHDSSRAKDARNLSHLVLR